MNRDVRRRREASVTKVLRQVHKSGVGLDVQGYYSKSRGLGGNDAVSELTRRGLGRSESDGRNESFDKFVKELHDSIYVERDSRGEHADEFRRIPFEFPNLQEEDDDDADVSLNIAGTSHNQWALHFAVSQQALPAVRVLLKAGSDPNAYNVVSPLSDPDFTTPSDVIHMVLETDYAREVIQHAVSEFDALSPEQQEQARDREQAFTGLRKILIIHTDFIIFSL